jgi:hypothetical protein
MLNHYLYIMNISEATVIYNIFVRGIKASCLSLEKRGDTSAKETHAWQT